MAANRSCHWSEVNLTPDLNNRAVVPWTTFHGALPFLTIPPSWPSQVLRALVELNSADWTGLIVLAGAVGLRTAGTGFAGVAHFWTGIGPSFGDNTVPGLGAGADCATTG